MKLNWQSKILIGSGGNANVYKMADATGKFFAVKVSKSTKNDKAYQRFCDEIKILERLNGNEGIVPILDKNLPEIISKTNRAYFIMPLCEKVNSQSHNSSFSHFYTLLINLARTLVDLHDNNIAHRDIKPENLLIYNGKIVFSDFGLAHFPKKEKISGAREKIGAKWTIAPEMERISSMAEYMKADVYSFAKTIYILITKESNAFEGQYITKSSISLDNYITLKSYDPNSRYEDSEYDSIVLLEKLLAAATDNDPSKRPSASDFAEMLAAWFNSSFQERNQHDWQDCISRIFPFSLPESSTWSKTTDIFSILQLLSREYNFLNYTFCPTSGGVDLTAVEYFDKKNNLLILNNYFIIKPNRLRFESFDNLDYSYFQLELETLKPLAEESVEREFLYIDSEKKYCFEQERGFTPIVRCLSGSFIITRKTSILNQLRGDYDGHFALQKNRSPEEYKILITSIVKKMKNKTESNSEIINT